MATLPKPQPVSAGRGYRKDPMFELATKLIKVANSVKEENNIDLFSEHARFFRDAVAMDAMRDFFCEDAYDREDKTLDQYDIQEIMEDMNAHYENDYETLKEYAAMSNFNPVIGMSYPIHKNILMNCMFDKGAIPKFVAREPRFPVSLESRFLIDTEGNEIDIFLHQNKIMEAVENTAPIKETILALPEMETTDILADTFKATRDDNLSIECYVSSVLIESWCEKGDTYYDKVAKKDVVMGAADTPGMKPVWIKIAPKYFTPGYGDVDRQLMAQFTVTIKTNVSGTKGQEQVKAFITGYTKKNRFFIQCSESRITNIKLAARLDASSAMLRTCQVTWKVRTDYIEIPDAKPINVAISPDEVKDLAALYQVNQLTKIMALFKDILGNYKDDKIHKYLDDSFLTMPETNKLTGTYDFAPRDGYFADHIEWRQKTFMDAMDGYVTRLLQVLNDPNMTVTVIGRQDLIRKVTPTEYSYQTPSSIGPVALDFTKTVVTSDRRVYQFIGSDKMRDNNNFIVLLCPRNTERFIYRLYDYQMYVSNEIRNSVNYALPAIHAFERWKMTEYQPIQARIRILNPTGLKTYVENADPIGPFGASNDNTANLPESVRPKLP